MQHSIGLEQMQEKFEAGDKEKIEALVAEALIWLENHPIATKEEFETQQKLFESVLNPILIKVYR